MFDTVCFWPGRRSEPRIVQVRRAGLRARGTWHLFWRGTPFATRGVAREYAKRTSYIGWGPGARLSALGPAGGEIFSDIARFHVKNWLKNWVLVSFGNFLVVWDCFGPRGGPSSAGRGAPGSPFFSAGGPGGLALKCQKCLLNPALQVRDVNVALMTQANYRCKWRSSFPQLSRHANTTSVSGVWRQLCLGLYFHLSCT
jgi:hypothetical protein